MIFDPQWLHFQKPEDRDQVDAWISDQGINPTECAWLEAHPIAADNTVVFRAKMYKMEHGSGMIDRATGSFLYTDDIVFSSRAQDLPECVVKTLEWPDDRKFFMEDHT